MTGSRSHAGSATSTSALAVLLSLALCQLPLLCASAWTGVGALVEA